MKQGEAEKACRVLVMNGISCQTEECLICFLSQGESVKNSFCFFSFLNWWSKNACCMLDGGKIGSRESREEEKLIK